MSITLCAFIKKENSYIDEWVMHHMNIGVDKFILYDNNDGKEDFPMTELVSRLVMNKTIHIEYKRNTKLDLHAERMNMYKSCDTDWMMFLDIDEFLVLHKFDNVNDWLSKDKFKDSHNIIVSIKSFDDNDILYCVNNHNVRQRFKRICFKSNRFNHKVKPIIRCNVDFYDIIPNGLVGKNIKTSYCDGKQYNINYIHPRIEVFDEIEIDAYPTKSLEEYCKIKVGRNKFDIEKINIYKEKYFELNKHTLEKDKLFNQFIQETYKNERIDGLHEYALHSYAEFNFGNGKPNNAN